MTENIDYDRPTNKPFPFLRRGEGAIHTIYGAVKYPSFGKNNNKMCKKRYESPNYEHPPTDSGYTDVESGPLSNQTISSSFIIPEDNTAQFETVEKLVEQRELSASSDNTLMEEFMNRRLDKNTSQRPKIPAKDDFIAIYENKPEIIESKEINDLDNEKGRQIEATNSSKSQLHQPANIENGSDLRPQFSFNPNDQHPSSSFPRSQQLPSNFATRMPPTPTMEEHKLACQLRTMIAQLDQDQAAFKKKQAQMEVEIERRKGELLLEQEESRNKVAKERKSLDEQQEKLWKARSYFEKQKSLVSKDEDERIRLLKDEIIRRQEDIFERDRQLSEQRVKVRELGQKLAKLENTVKRVKAENDRLVSRNRELEKETDENRAKTARKALALMAESSMNRRTSAGDTSNPLRKVDFLGQRSASQPRLKTVRFTVPEDVHEETSTTDVPLYNEVGINRDGAQKRAPLNGMQVIKSVTNSDRSVCTTYADSSTWTTVTVESDHCTNYVYSNGDIRWIHAKNTVELHHFFNGGMTSLDIGPYITVQFFPEFAQVDIFHKDGSVSNCRGDGVRVETMPDGGVFRQMLDGKKCNNPVRSDMSCWVDGLVDGTSEFRSVEFMLRRWPDGNVKLKLVQLDMEVTLLVDGRGTVKHLQADGQKRQCCHWDQ